jgi:anti-sigma factor RsiW
VRSGRAVCKGLSDVAEQNDHCIDPSALAPGDLIAYVTGEAEAPVMAHLQRCAACRAEAAAYERLQSRLQATLGRPACPPTLTLAEYALDLLAPAERQAVAAHLVACAACRAEQRDAAAFLADDTGAATAHGLRAGLRQLIARPMRFSPLAAGLRGAATDESMTYEAGEVRLTVAVQRAARGGAFVISGLLEDWERFAGASVRLLSGDDVIAPATVDDLGSFSLESVPAGSYRLEIERDEVLIAIEQLAVGSA